MCLISKSYFYFFFYFVYFLLSNIYPFLGFLVKKNTILLTTNSICGLRYIYFWLRFCFVNVIKDYSRLKIHVVCSREFLVLNSSYQIWVRLIFIYQKYLNERLKPVFWVQNRLFDLRSRVVNSHRLFCSQRAGMKFRIKAFWYTKVIFYSKSCCEMFVLKLSGIQKTLWWKNT